MVLKARFRGFGADIVLSKEDGIYYGRAVDGRNVISFQGETEDDAIENFQVAVENHLNALSPYVGGCR